MTAPTTNIPHTLSDGARSQFPRGEEPSPTGRGADSHGARSQVPRGKEKGQGDSDIICIIFVIPVRLPPDTFSFLCLSVSAMTCERFQLSASNFTRGFQRTKVRSSMFFDYICQRSRWQWRHLQRTSMPKSVCATWRQTWHKWVGKHHLQIPSRFDDLIVI